MKGLILFLFLIFYSQSGFSQIEARTSSGKKVILNMDGTWKYADNSSSKPVRPCEENHTGNLTVKNNTENDIYFYYSAEGEHSISTKFVKIKPRSSKAINDLAISYGSDRHPVKYDYVWKATNEIQRNEMPTSQMQGIENGTFTLVQCDSIEVEVGN